VVQVADVGQVLGEQVGVVPLDPAVDDVRDAERGDFGELLVVVDVPADGEGGGDEVQVRVGRDRKGLGDGAPPEIRGCLPSA